MLTTGLAAASGAETTPFPMLTNTPVEWNEAAPPSGDFPFLPAAEAKDVALALAIERATPEMMTRVLDALDAADAEAPAIDVVDLAVANAMLYYAGPGFVPGLGIAEHARGVLDEVTRVRVADTIDVDTNEPTEGVAFDTNGVVLATGGKILRQDVQSLTYERVLDYQWMYEHLSVEEYSYFYHKYYRYYSYAYHQYTRHYTLSVDYDYRLQVLSSYYQEMQEWVYTRGVTTQVVDNVADAGNGLQGHALSTVVTPFMHVDHWWMIVYTESLFREHRSIDYDYSYYCSQYHSYCGSPSPRTPPATRTVWVESYSGEDSGMERTLFPMQALLGNLEISYFLPANEYQPLARATPLFNTATAPLGQITNQVGVEYKDRKTSDVLLANPVLSDIGFAFDEEPFMSATLTRADEVVATFDTHWNEFRTTAGNAQADAESAAADAQGAVAPLLADPVAFIVDATTPPEEYPVTVDVGETLATIEGAAADPEGFVASLGVDVPDATLPEDPESDVAATVADVQAAAANAVADAQADADALQAIVMGILEDPEGFAAGVESDARALTVDTPEESVDASTDADDHAWIVASFNQGVGRAYDDVRAVFALTTTQDAYAVDGDKVYVKVSADGLGEAFLFALDLNGATLVADQVTVGGESVNVGETIDEVEDAAANTPQPPAPPAARVAPVHDRILRWEVDL